MTDSLVCVDANLTLKLVLQESDSDLTLSLWEAWDRQQVMVIAPYLWAYEVTSVIRNQIHRGQLSLELGFEAFTAIHQLPVQLLQPDELHQRAWELAHRFDHSAAYDAHYLALAEMTGCPFWTADQRLLNVVGNELDWVFWLGDYKTSPEKP